MFKSFNYATDMEGASYNLTDSDFVDSGHYLPSNTGVWGIIIDAYEKRNLPVAINLLKAMIWWCEQGNNKLSLVSIIKWCKTNTPQFAKYETDFEKYLLLL